MSKNVIVFGHQYTKLHGQTHGVLLTVSLTTLEQESKRMVELDTEYVEDGITKHYQLKPGCMYLLLIFQGNKNIPFTTLRKAKGNFYNTMRNKLGQEFSFPQLPVE